MFTIVSTLLRYPLSWLRSRHQLGLENLALRHQITVLKRQRPRPKFRPWDRWLWIMLKRVWPNWKTPLMIFQPETIIGWQRAGFRMFWRWNSRGRSGRPRKDAGAIAAMDFFVVPTVTFRLLYVLVVITQERRKVVHFNITEAPSAQWTVQQVVNAFSYDTAPKYLLRDRDCIYGSSFVQRVEGMGIKQKMISPRSPWQSPYVERLVGSIRRECLDQVIVFSPRQLRQLLQSYLDYYHHFRPHRSLDHDSPVPRPVESPDRGKVIELPLVGGLHHRYLRQAA